MELPKFKYHSDPLKSGSIIESDAVCLCCGKATGYIYGGLPYSEVELEDSICPWCIADGTAHKKFDAEFTDYDGIGGYGDWDDVASSVKEEITYLTPGFTGWQQEKWWTHCNDGTDFLGCAGFREINEYGQDLEVSLKSEATATYGLKDGEWEGFFQSLDADGSPSAYIFKCIHCGKLGGYIDFD
ncbi:UPF0167 protein [Alteromonas sp. KC3]|uniref:CbrC family protein n=1 Tax=unclassified Alteromonas TaxID=2614992 RepID=UPI001921D5AE|nr:MULTISPECIES: CbrC family protein [unclassified Alteromonas]BCO18982.1 UPF0167 protein [Alteromonas sp. KC3]BCO22939.1 UPF0167 protein [Alteromonas sp. KC14]